MLRGRRLRPDSRYIWGYRKKRFWAKQRYRVLKINLWKFPKWETRRLRTPGSAPASRLALRCKLLGIKRRTRIPQINSLTVNVLSRYPVPRTTQGLPPVSVTRLTEQCDRPIFKKRPLYAIMHGWFV